MKYITALSTVLTMTSLTFSQTPNQNQNQNQNSQSSGQSSQTQQSKDAQSGTSGASFGSASSGQASSSSTGNQSGQVRLQELPPAVQKSVQKHCGTHKINSIERTQRHGQPVYDVEYTDEEGPDEIILVIDGTLLEDVDAPQGAAAPAVIGVIAPARLAGHTGTEYSELPPAVQRQTGRYGGEDQIVDIDTAGPEEAVIYVIEFARPGPNLQVAYAEDGSVKTSGNIDNATGQGSYPAGQQGTGASTSSQDQKQDQQQGQQKEQSGQNKKSE